MPLDLYGEESKVVDYLSRNGLDEVQAKIYTVILCRQYHAPQSELMSLLEFHLPGSNRKSASTESQIESALKRLTKLKLIRVVRGKKEDFIEATTPWDKAIGALLPKKSSLEPDILAIIHDSLKHFADYAPRERALIERLGWASWEKPRQSFREAISEAHNLIRLGVYSSITVYDEVKDQVFKALVEHQEMRIQILMFSPKLAARIENNADLAKDVEIRTKDWQELYKRARIEAKKLEHKPTLEIRHITDESFSAFHRVVLIDNRKWILNVHRPGVERGVEGMVYQGTCEEKSPSNIYNLLDFYWQAVWQSAKPVTPIAIVLRWLKDNQHLIVLPLLVIIGWILFTTQGNWLGIANEWWGGALIGLAISELYNHGTSILSALLEFFKKIIEALQRSMSPEVE